MDPSTSAEGATGGVFRVMARVEYSLVKPQELRNYRMGSLQTNERVKFPGFFRKT